jgi:tetratricopeptide (TPR) repeat protein
MAFFGYPEAHDNDGERAARAGLAIVDAISNLNEHPTHPKLSARIGIDSGAVVVPAGADGNADVFGDTPHRSARADITAFSSGDLPTAAALADQALEIALREHNSVSLGFVYTLQIATRYDLCDLVDDEKHFTAGLKFFDDPIFRQAAEASVMVFGFASFNAWMLGRADVARERMARMTAAADENHPYEMACAADLGDDRRILLGEYEQVEALAGRALELSEKNYYPLVAAWSRSALGRARMHLGRATEGIGLIRHGMADFLGTGAPTGITFFAISLSPALAREGAVIDAIETIEKTIQANPPELVIRPEILRIRGELRLKQGQTELPKQTSAKLSRSRKRARRRGNCARRQASRECCAT